MLLDLDPFWLLMAVAAVGVVSLVFGSALDALMRDDGFGPLGNMVVLTSGFFLAIGAANRLGYSFDEVLVASGVGLAGSFLVLVVLSFTKAGLARL
ncbi:MAG: hypothetical protein AB7I79_15860 [Rhizobiaceae bacterium]